MSIFAPQIAFKKQSGELAEQERQANKIINKQKAQDRLESGEENVIDKFKALNPLADYLVDEWGATIQGNKYCSPNSTTGNAAIVVMGDKAFSHHGSDSHIGKENNDGVMFDQVDLFFELHNGGVVNMKLLNDEVSGKTDSERKREYAQAKSIETALEGLDFEAIPGSNVVDINPAGVSRKKLSPLDKLKALSAVNRLDDMKKNLENDRFVFEGMALAGQITLFYSKPNTGKTLLFMRMLIDAINEDRVKAEDVFYINADDHYKGLVTKTEIAHRYGFEMISPAEAGINQSEIIEILEALAASGSAKGKVIILDTLKKFADMMSKSSQSALYQVLRKLIAKDATVIIAGHANKYADESGKLIYEGTADTMNDIDCAYSINLTSVPEGDVTVEFIREKNRGDNKYSVAYTYRKVEGMSYQEMIDSVTMTSDDIIHESYQSDVTTLLEQYEAEILFIKDVLKEGTANQSHILKIFKDAKGKGLSGEFSQRTLKQALEKLDGHLWKAKRNRTNNAKEYTINPPGDYRTVKNGG